MIFKELSKEIKKQDLIGGFLAGLALFSAFSIQTFGLQLTTPGKNAFLTAVYCTIVPLLSWLYFKKSPAKKPPIKSCFFISFILLKNKHVIKIVLSTKRMHNKVNGEIKSTAFFITMKELPQISAAINNIHLPIVSFFIYSLTYNLVNNNTVRFIFHYKIVF